MESWFTQSRQDCRLKTVEPFTCSTTANRVTIVSCYSKNADYVRLIHGAPCGNQGADVTGVKSVALSPIFRKVGSAGIVEHPGNSFSVARDFDELIGVSVVFDGFH